MIAVSGVVFSCGIDTEAAVVRRLEKLRGVEPGKETPGRVVMVEMECLFGEVTAALSLAA